jgi:phosphatidylinositol glycan class T
LWAWVEAEDSKQADSRWEALTNALSGLFCASLNFIDSTRTIRPVRSFVPQGHHPKSEDGSLLHLLHGALPKEPVCTENLTPFLKLLPCKGKAGISSLLNGHKLFDASWQSMSIDVRPICPTGADDESECVLEIEQTVDMVLDIDRSKRPQDNPIPRPIPIENLVCDSTKPYAAEDTCYPLDNKFLPDWSLIELFGRPLHGTCPLGDDFEDRYPVCVKVSPEQSVLSAGAKDTKFYPHQDLNCYKLIPDTDFDLKMPESEASTAVPVEKPRFYAERTLTGHGQERGGVQTIITNPSETEDLELVYMETTPWFMKIYLHTLKAKVSSHLSPSSSSTFAQTQGFTPPSLNLSQSTANGDLPAGKELIREIHYRPALDRERGTQLEILLTVPASAIVILTYDFEKAILRYTEYPPDANRGFDVASAVIATISDPQDDSVLNLVADSNGGERSIVPGSRPTTRTSLRTTSLLLYLPTPDFSMPYNVIILTSTVLALAFGSIFNLLARRLVLAEEVVGLKGQVLKIRDLIKERIGKWFGKGKTDASLTKTAEADSTPGTVVEKEEGKEK